MTDPPPPPNDDSAATAGGGAPQLPKENEVKDNHESEARNYVGWIGQVKPLLCEILQEQRKTTTAVGKTKWPDFLAPLFFLAALGSAVFAGWQYEEAAKQYKLAEKTLENSFLLQLKKDTSDTDKYLAEGTPRIRDFAIHGCPAERLGDLEYAANYQQAKAELDNVIDFYDFYAKAYSDYSLMTDASWKDVCSGAKAVATSNCFYQKEWNGAIGRRQNSNLERDLRICGAAQ
jgi:hypothetical protein